MADYLNLRPVSADGTELDATFDLARESVFCITYHHKAGARGSPRSVNADYHHGLELLLHRLASLGADIWDISVHSGVARKLDPPDRRLKLHFPIRLEQRTEIHELRMDITARKSPSRVARVSDRTVATIRKPSGSPSAVTSH